MQNPENIDSELWVEKYGDMMYRFTLVRVKDQDVAEEVVQSTLIAALQAQKTFQGRSTEKSWLFGILKHKIMDHFRATKKFQIYDRAPDDDSDPYEKAFDQSKHWKIPVQNWNMDPEKAAQNGQLVDALSHCLDKLSDKYRGIFVMREVDGVSSEEICKKFNIQPTNLWVMLHRARNQLKKCLETQWFNK